MFWMDAIESMPVAQMWNQIFSLTESDFKKPLTPKILSNPNNSIVKTLIYIYSMESFIYKEMNRACRLKDTSKIKFYGAYASALSFIIHCGNKSNKELGKVFTVFRGFSLLKDDFENTYKVGDFLSLNSFTSTTLSIEQGFKYALGDFSSDDVSKIPVLLEIDFEGANQFFFLNSDAYSAFAYEEEVLF